MKTAEEILQDKFEGLESKINKPNVYQTPLILAAMEEYARAKWDEACEAQKQWCYANMVSEPYRPGHCVQNAPKPEFKA